MRSFYKFATLFLFFHNIIFLSHIKADPTSNVEIDEPIRSMASNGEILGIVLPNKIHFYSLISSSPSQTLLNDLFSMKFNEIEFKEDFNFELLPDNRFVLCLVDSCRFYQIHPAEKTVSLLFNATSDVPFSTWAAIILDDKLLVSYLPSVKPNSNAVIKSFSLDGGNAMGKADDYVAIFQEKKVQGFERNGYSYFVNTVFEHDLYSDEIKRSYDNITRTRLTRICSDDNSRDLVTKINIHLACGTQPADYWSFPEQHFESSFLSTDKERLFVLFRSKDNGYISCSYSMTEIDSYFAKVWTACQSIESHDMFQDECILNRKAEFCSFTWKRSSSSSNCQRFGIGYTKKRFNNCAVSRETQTLGRNAWIENFFPVWGNTENKFSEAQILAGLDQNTFMAFSESKALKRIQVNTPQQLPLWDKKADRFITVLANSTHPAHIIYSVNNQVQAQRVTCAALYSDCKQIRWDDPLECMYCSFANSSGYVSHLSVENNRTCEQAEGKVIVNQCPPVISSVTIGSSDVTVVGDYLTNFKDRPRVSVCDTDCEIFTFQLNAITCKLNDISPTCEVRIVGDLESVKDYSIYHTNSNGDDLNLDGEDQTSTTSSSKSAGRATKFIVGIVAALFLLTIVIIIGYIIMTKKCTQNNNHSIPSKPFIPDLDSNALSDPYPYNSISTTEVIDPEYNMELYGIMAFDHNKIEKINTIGKGNFSRVFKYRYKDAPFEEVAVKEIWDGDMREVKLISRCQHPNIVSYYGYFRRENNICLVMEFLDGGDLHKYLLDRSNHFSCREGFDIVQQIVEGMRYLTSQDIIHRDLAARNCIMNKDHTVVKISDFGLSRKSDLSGVYHPLDTKTKLPFRWTAIECLNGEGFTEKSDVWSFGVVCWEVFSRDEYPYSDIKLIQGIESFLEQGGRLEHPGEGCPIELYEVMKTCWAKDPANRPTFTQLQRTLDQTIEYLINGEVDYSNVYLTPRASMTNDGSHSTPTIMDDSDVSNFVRERNSTTGQVSVS